MTYVRPDTLGEALDWLASHEGRVAAGCTDLFTLTQNQELPWPVVDVTAIAELKAIGHGAHGWRIGAAASWRSIIAADLPPAFDALKLAAREVGSSQIQTSATIGGNLCNASPAADGVPPLLVLDAGVEIASAAGIRTLPLAAFLTGPRQTALQPGEMLTAILIPDAAAQGRAHFLKLGARKHLLISIAMVAARLTLEGGRIRDAAVSVGNRVGRCGLVQSGAAGESARSDAGCGGRVGVGRGRFQLRAGDRLCRFRRRKRRRGGGVDRLSGIALGAGIGRSGGQRHRCGYHSGGRYRQARCSLHGSLLVGSGVLTRQTS